MNMSCQREGGRACQKITQSTPPKVCFAYKYEHFVKHKSVVHPKKFVLYTKMRGTTPRLDGWCGGGGAKRVHSPPPKFGWRGAGARAKAAAWCAAQVGWVCRRDPGRSGCTDRRPGRVDEPWAPEQNGLVDRPPGLVGGPPGPGAQRLSGAARGRAAAMLTAPRAMKADRHNNVDATERLCLSKKNLKPASKLCNTVSG